MRPADRMQIEYGGTPVRDVLRRDRTREEPRWLGPTVGFAGGCALLFGAPRLLDLLFGTAWLFWALLAGAVTLAGHAVVCLIGLLGCLCRR